MSELVELDAVGSGGAIPQGTDSGQPQAPADTPQAAHVYAEPLGAPVRPPSRRRRKTRLQTDEEDDDDLPTPRLRRQTGTPAPPSDTPRALFPDSLFIRAPLNATSAQYWENMSTVFFGGVAAQDLAAVESLRRAAVTDSLCCLDAPLSARVGGALQHQEATVPTGSLSSPTRSPPVADPLSSALAAPAPGSSLGAIPGEGSVADSAVVADTDPPRLVIRSPRTDDQAPKKRGRPGSVSLSAGASSPTAVSPLSSAKLFHMSPLVGDRLSGGAAGRVQIVADAFGMSAADCWAALADAPPSTMESGGCAGTGPYSAEQPPFGFSMPGEGGGTTAVVQPGSVSHLSPASFYAGQAHDAVHDALSLAMRQLAALGAQNAQRLDALLENLRLECSLQTLYAQLGRPLTAAPEDAPGVDCTAATLEWDSSGAPLPPSTAAIPAPGTLACEAALHNTYWAVTGPRCDLSLDRKLGADLGLRTTWRFGGDVGDSAAVVAVSAPEAGAAPAGSASRPRVGFKGPFKGALCAPLAAADPDAPAVARAWSYPAASLQAGFAAFRLSEKSFRSSADVAEGRIAADAYRSSLATRHPPFLPPVVVSFRAAASASCDEAPAPPQLDNEVVVSVPEVTGAEPLVGIGTGELPASRGRRGGRRGGRHAMRGSVGRYQRRGTRAADAGSSIDDSAGSDGSGDAASVVLTAAEVAAVEAAAEAAALRARLGRALERVRPAPFPGAQRLIDAVGTPFMSWDCPAPQPLGVAGGSVSGESDWDFPDDFPWSAAAAEEDEKRGGPGAPDALSGGNDVFAAAEALGEERAGDRGSKRRRAAETPASAAPLTSAPPPALLSATEVRRGALIRAALAASAAVFTPGLLHPVQAALSVGGRQGGASAPLPPAPALVDLPVQPRLLLLQTAEAAASPLRREAPRAALLRATVAPVPEPLNSEYRPPVLPGLAEAAPYLDEVRRLMSPLPQRAGRQGAAGKGRRAGIRGRGGTLDDGGAEGAAPAPSLGAAQADARAFLSAAPLGTVVEARDAAGGWYVAVIIAEARDAGSLRRYVRVRYGGWDSCVDDWVSVEASPPVVLPLGTHLRRRQAAAGGGGRGRR